MSWDMLAALAGFALAASLSPGPNNFMLLASGVNFGFRRTMPHMAGIGVGFFALLIGVGLGLGALLSAYPALHALLKVLGAGYLLYLAWRTATARSFDTRVKEGARPMTFAEAAAFQWVNPKAWIMSVTAMAVYTQPETPLVSVFVVAGIFAAICFPSVGTWTGFGTALRGFLADPGRLKWFNLTMGVLLAASVLPMVM